MPRQSSKYQQRGSCVEDGMGACSSDGSASVSTDWLSELMDSGLDVDDLQVDAGLLPGDEQLGDLLASSSLAGVAADHRCGRECGCGFALQPLPQHGACEPLPALAELLRCGQHGGDCGADDAEQWLPELPDGMEFPVSGADPLEEMLAELSGPDEGFNELGTQSPPASSGHASPARPHPAEQPAAWASPSVTTGSAQTHASPGAWPRSAASADGATVASGSAASEPAQSSDCAHSAAAAAAAGASARESSPGCESSPQQVSPQAPQRSSSGSASPAASDSEGSGPSSRQPAAPAAAGGGGAGPQAGGLHSSVGPTAAAPVLQQVAPGLPPQQWQPLQAALQQQVWQQQQQQQQQPPQQQAAASSDGAPPAFTSGGAPPGEEAQRAARVARNRESAQQSRQRRRAQVDEVQRRCDELQSHNGQLAGVVQRLTAENALLRHQLLVVCAATGATPPMPVPPPPFAAGAAPPPPQPAPLGAAPKIPIQKLKPQRPTPAPQRSAPGARSSLPVSSPPDAPQPARKKLKSAAGATTALLAVFACVMLLSPMGAPGGGGGGAALQGAAVVPYAPAGRPLAAGRGRVLTALPPAQLPGNATTHAQAVEVVRGMLNDLSELGAAGGGGSDAGPVNVSEALALRYNDPVLETLALQRLKELAPLALFSAGDAQLLPGGRTFGGVAGEVLGAEGLAAPVACRQVFRFDAARVLRPDFPAARMEAYIDSLTTPKRRRAQALPLLPVGGSGSDGGGSGGDEGHHSAAGEGGRRTGGRSFGGARAGGQQQQRKQRRPTIGADDDDTASSPGGDGSSRLGGSTLVSMLLPTRNASAQQAGNLTALDQIYIVMMEPSDMYATYSCRLPSPVLI